MLWYQVPYVVEVTIGLLASLYFMLTWWKGVTRKFTLAAFDAGGWVLLFLAVFVLLFVNMWVYGLPEPSSVSRGVQNLLIYLAVDSVAITRVLRWRQIQRETAEDRAYLGEGEST